MRGFAPRELVLSREVARGTYRQQSRYVNPCIYTT
jgi:hypothetical protein